MGLFSSTYGQLNSFKYIIVPKRFDIFTEDNIHQTSVLIKHLFTERGYLAVYDDELPADLVDRRCLGAVVELENNSTLLKTNLVIALRDCNSALIFKSPQGSSKKKDFKEAYHEAIREAFAVFDDMEYQYKPEEETEEVVTVSFEDDIKTVEEVKEETVSTESTVTQVATPEEQYYRDMRPETTSYVKSETSDTTEVETPETEEKVEVLTAKEVVNGYQLVDSEEKVQLTLFKTSSGDVFLAKHEQGDGMVYKKDLKWYFEYYEGSDLIVKELNILFQ